MLAQHHGDVNAVTPELADSNALHLAVQGQFVDTVLALLLVGANPHARNGEQRTPLDIAMDAHKMSHNDPLYDDENNAEIIELLHEVRLCA